jgi:hypothetical protein
LFLEDHVALVDYENAPITTPGSHEYPFSIYLSHDLAPSMSLENDDGSCSVSYILTADIQNQCSTERTLHVVGAPYDPCKKHPFYFQPTKFPLKNALGAQSGYLILAAKVDNTHIGKGTPLEFSLACRNHSHQDIQRVEFRLFEVVSWSAGSEKHHKTSLANFDDVVLDSLFKKGIRADADNSPEEKEKESSSSAATIGGHWADDLQQVNGRTLAEMHSEVTSPKNVVVVTIPTTAKDSYAGKMIQVSHYLQITLVVKDKPSDPHVKIPITVLDQPMLESALHLHRHTHELSCQKVQEVATALWKDGVPTS